MSANKTTAVVRGRLRSFAVRSAFAEKPDQYTMSSKISEPRRNFMRTSAAVIPVVTLGASLLHSAFAKPAPLALAHYQPVFFTLASGSSSSRRATA
jgi:hypothetical protein